MSNIYNNPEIAKPMGLDLPPVEYDLNLRKTGAVLAGVSAFAFTGAALHSPQEANTQTVACPNSSANNIASFSGPDFSQPDVAGYDSSIKANGLGLGTNYTCTGDNQNSIANFLVQRNGSDFSPLSVDFKTSPESGITILRVQDGTNSTSLSCAKDPSEVNLSHCIIPDMYQKQVKPLFVEFKANNPAIGQTISASLSTDINTDNNSSQIAFEVKQGSVSTTSSAGNVSRQGTVPQVNENINKKWKVVPYTLLPPTYRKFNFCVNGIFYIQPPKPYNKVKIRGISYSQPNKVRTIVTRNLNVLKTSGYNFKTKVCTKDKMPILRLVASSNKKTLNTQTLSYIWSKRKWKISDGKSITYFPTSSGSSVKR